MEDSTAALISIIINLGLPVGVIILAMFVGSRLEAKHYESIKRREKEFLSLPAIPSATHDVTREIEEARMVSGSVVVSIDYFKKFLAGLRNIFGGRVGAYESLLDRGRREAVLRMKEEFPGADIIVNMRMETSSIGKGSLRGNKGGIGCVEVIAYGTAIKYAGSKL